MRARSEDRPRAISSRRYINTKSRAAARRRRSGARASRVQKSYMSAIVSLRYTMLERRRLAASAATKKPAPVQPRRVRKARGVHRVKSVARTKSACSDAAAGSIFARRVFRRIRPERVRWVPGGAYEARAPCGATGRRCRVARLRFPPYCRTRSQGARHAARGLMRTRRQSRYCVLRPRASCRQRGRILHADETRRVRRPPCTILSWKTPPSWQWPLSCPDRPCPDPRDPPECRPALLGTG